MKIRENLPDPFIHEKATVIGNVKLAKGVSIWPGAVLRADMHDIILGEGVNIQDNSTIHTDFKKPVIIGDYTLVGHNAMLHGCKIGKGCLIGINATVLDDAEIGDGAMITAGCLIRGGTKIPPKAMVIQKKGEIKIIENKARTMFTVAGSLEYIRLIEMHQKNEFIRFTEEDEKALQEEAKEIIKEWGL
ncbi:MAG: gamma carbonic anhydrase family protein [Candidatus Hydrogenedentota bacterium]|nr:MAG: gamma carbonic anhydrase family protein [Candidatus Hydrogenedentota bacterium]